ncbi:MAG: DUF5723 family protein [Muribaculaceae bacterium]|nr:DUF5723 family protein [Muribaculaceae bacterium]
MKKSFKYILSAGLISLSGLFMSAQTLHSLYFLEGNNQRHNLNPAFTSESGYVTFPALGNLYVGTNSNIGLGAFLRPGTNSNEMVTFLHSSISAEDALSKFKDNNIIEADLGINIISVGFNAWGGSNTIGINVKSNTGVYLPKSIFTFLKTGQDPNSAYTEYDISDIKATTQNYGELAFGHSRKINDKLSVGAKLKVLLGMAYAETEANNMKIYMSDSKWMIKQTSSLIASKGANMTTTNNNKIDEFKFEDFGVAGFGLGLDLGAIYKINDNLTVSLAVTDLGFMSWNDCQKASNKNKEFEFTGFTNIGVEDKPDGSNDFDDAADEVWDNLKGLVEYTKEDATVTQTKSLYTTIRAAGEYGILNNKISFGLLGSMRLGAPKTYTEAMVTANFRPWNWFNASVNGSLSNVRGSLGAVLNFHPGAVNFFIGMDYFLATYSKQFIPVDAAKVNGSLGFSINF